MSEGAGFGGARATGAAGEQQFGATIPAQRQPSVAPSFFTPASAAPSLFTPASAGTGFPLARVFDGVKPDGSPLISRPNLDPREIPALVAYLTRAPVALTAPGTTRDELVPSAPASVPRAFHTDGTWVWPAAVGYYLSLYRLPPQAELLEHVRSRHYALEPVQPPTIQAVASQVLAILNSKPQTPPQAPQVPAGQPKPQIAAPQPQTQLPPKPAVPGLSAFSAGFNDAGNRHAAWVSEQLDTFLAFLPLGDWTVDHATRRYLKAGRSIIVDGLGTLSPSGVWTWAWADPATWGQDSAITEQSRRLRALGMAEGIAELVTPRFGLSGIADAPESPQDAAEMVAWTAMGLLGARGYIGHSHVGHGAGEQANGGRIYYAVCDASVPAAKPGPSTVPRFLLEGAATFGEDAADCVLGYIDHYGWEWSRVPDGIAFAADGIGAFTAEFASTGELTGVSTGVLLRA